MNVTHVCDFLLWCCFPVFEKKRNVHFKKRRSSKIYSKLCHKIANKQTLHTEIDQTKDYKSMNHVQLEEPLGKKLWESTLGFMLSLWNIFYVLIHHQKEKENHNGIME